MAVSLAVKSIGKVTEWSLVRVVPLTERSLVQVPEPTEKSVDGSLSKALNTNFSCKSLRIRASAK